MSLSMLNAISSTKTKPLSRHPEFPMSIPCSLFICTRFSIHFLTSVKLVSCVVSTPWPRICLLSSFLGHCLSSATAKTILASSQLAVFSAKLSGCDCLQNDSKPLSRQASCCRLQIVKGNSSAYFLHASYKEVISHH